MDSTFVIYSGPSLPYINVVGTDNNNLQVVLGKINTAINASSAAPDYTTYSLGCVKQTDGTSHPTNTQNFAEGISLMLCDLLSAYTTFTGTTYPADRAAISAAVLALQEPALTYAPYGITSADTIGTVWSKIFTGTTATIASISPASANWSTIGYSAPSTTTGAFNSMIAYVFGLHSTIGGLQSSLGTFNTSGTCLAGGGADSPRTTINNIISYICGLPTYDTDSITWSCVSQGGDLQTDIQALVNSISSMQTNYIAGVGTGLTRAIITSCGGYQASIDTTWSGLYKTMVNGSDPTPGFLGSKLTSTNGTVTITQVGNTTVNFEVATPVDHKVLVNASDTTPGYLINKISPNTSDWGITIVMSTSPDNSQVILTPMVTNPGLLASSLMTYVATDPDAVAQWCAINTQCFGCTCAAPTGLTVSVSGGVYALAWTPAAGTISQNAIYRQRSSLDWIYNIGISPINPLTSVASSATIRGLATNIVYQFQVTSVCSSVSNTSNIYEAITFACQTVTPTVISHVLSVNQNPLPTVDTIQYQLVNNSSVVVATLITSGVSPSVTFAAQNAGTYSLRYRYGATVNGTTLYSDDASQLGAWCVLTGIAL